MYQHIELYDRDPSILSCSERWLGRITYETVKDRHGSEPFQNSPVASRKVPGRQTVCDMLYVGSPGRI